MSQHHLDELTYALRHKGWAISSTRTLNDFPYDFHVWTIERGSVTVDIQFARFGTLGEDVPLDQSFSCSIAGHAAISLYFSKPSDRWKTELASFISALDEIGGYTVCMNLLDDVLLEGSAVVANSWMNRERAAVGVNSYEQDLGFNAIEFLADRLKVAGSAAWLDLCCGRGRALLEAAEVFRDSSPKQNVVLHGVDLVDEFDETPTGVAHVQLKSASLHQWEPTRKYDLITCVHGMHYLGDKLSLIERATGWLTGEGVVLANLDLANLRLAGGQTLVRRITKRFRDGGLIYNTRRHLLTCNGAKSLNLGLRYLGADDRAGPNYSGQDAVDSYYE